MKPGILLVGRCDGDDALATWAEAAGVPLRQTRTDGDALAAAELGPWGALLVVFEDAALAQLTLVARLRELPGLKDVRIIGATAVEGAARTRLDSFAQHLGVQSWVSLPLVPSEVEAAAAERLGLTPATQEPDLDEQLIRRANDLADAMLHERLGVPADAPEPAWRAAYEAEVTHTHELAQAAPTAAGHQAASRIQALLREAVEHGPARPAPTSAEPEEKTPAESVRAAGPDEALIAEAERVATLDAWAVLGVDPDCDDAVWRNAFYGQMAAAQHRARRAETAAGQAAAARILQRIKGAAAELERGVVCSPIATPPTPVAPPKPVSSTQAPAGETAPAEAAQPTETPEVGSQTTEAPAPESPLVTWAARLTGQSAWERLEIPPGSDESIWRGAYYGQLARWRRAASEARDAASRGAGQTVRQLLDAALAELDTAPESAAAPGVAPARASAETAARPGPVPSPAARADAASTRSPEAEDALERWAHRLAKQQTPHERLGVPADADDATWRGAFYGQLGRVKRGLSTARGPARQAGETIQRLLTEAASAMEARDDLSPAARPAPSTLKPQPEQQPKPQPEQPKPQPEQPTRDAAPPVEGRRRRAAPTSAESPWARGPASAGPATRPESASSPSNATGQPEPAAQPEPVGTDGSEPTPQSVSVPRAAEPNGEARARVESAADTEPMPAASRPADREPAPPPVTSDPDLLLALGRAAGLVGQVAASRHWLNAAADLAPASGPVQHALDVVTIREQLAAGNRDDARTALEALDHDEVPASLATRLRSENALLRQLLTDWPE